MRHSRLVVIAALAALVLILGAGVSWAAENAQSDQPEAGQAAPPEKSRNIPTALIAIAAALAVGLPAFGTALAQSRIGAAGCGTIAEKPDTAGTIILLIAIPETMVILGFVVAVVLVFAL